MDVEHPLPTDGRGTHPAVDWQATVRLGALVSLLAGLLAATLHGVVADASIIALVTVGSLLASSRRLGHHLPQVRSH